MVGAGAVVAEAHRGVRADEDGTGVADLRGPAGGVVGLDLEVLGGVGVDHVDALLEVVDQHDAGLLAPERDQDALGVLGGVDLLVELALDLVGQPLGRGDEDGGGQRVVLGLAHQVGGDVGGVGGVVGEDGDLGGPGLGVDADPAAQQPLGGGDVDVAGTGDEVDLGARPDAVGEHRDRLGAADGVHLGDAEQRAGREDAGMRQPAVVLLGRAGQRDRADAGGLRRHHVHDYGAQQRRQAARHVEPDPAHRHLAVHDPGARREVGGDVVLQLGRAGQAQPADRLLEGGTDRRVELLQRRGQRGLGHPDVVAAHAVEALVVVEHRLETPGADRLADRVHRRDRRLDVEVGARHRRPVALGALRPALTTQVDTADHGSILRSRVSRRRLGGGRWTRGSGVARRAPHDSDGPRPPPPPVEPVARPAPPRQQVRWTL